MSRVPDADLPDDLPVKNSLVRALYGNPDMFRGFASMSGRVHSTSHLPDRLREVVVLRITGMLGAEFEWTAHVRIAGRVGLSRDDVEALRTGALGRFSPAEQAAIRLAEASDRCQVDDDVWAAASAHFSSGELVELLLLSGFYAMASRIAVALDITPDVDPTT